MVLMGKICVVYTLKLITVMLNKQLYGLLPLLTIDVIVKCIYPCLSSHYSKFLVLSFKIDAV